MHSETVRWLIGLSIGTVGTVGTETAPLWRLRARRSRLTTFAHTHSAQWAALSRVRRGAHFLDHGRGRGHGGPSGTLLLSSDCLSWHPDGYEQGHGDRSWQWSAADVRCDCSRTRTRTRRDITGITYLQVTLTVPQGQVVLSIARQTGDLPLVLTPAPR